LIEAEASECWPLLSDLLGGTLPEGCSWAGTRTAAARGQNVLVPAMAVDDRDRADILDYFRFVTPALGYGVRAGRLLQEAAKVFLDNVDEHAIDLPIQPVVCAAFDPVGHNLQLACVNLDGPQTRPTRTESDLKQMVTGAQQEFPSIATLATSVRDDLAFTIRLVTGTGHARHRTGDDWRFATGIFVPGFVAGIEVHR
jgi:hypothetical protein